MHLNRPRWCVAISHHRWSARFGTNTHESREAHIRGIDGTVTGIDKGIVKEAAECTAQEWRDDGNLSSTVSNLVESKGGNLHTQK